MVFNRYAPVIGGAERQGRQLASALQQRGHHIRIVTRRLEKGLSPLTTIDGLPVRRLLPTGLSTVSNIVITVRLWWYLWWYPYPLDVLYVQGVGPIAIAALAAARLRGVPILLRISTSGDLQRNRYLHKSPSLLSRLVRRVLLPDRLWRWLLRRAHTIIVLSQAMLDEARDMLPEKQLALIPNGVDLDHFAPPSQTQRLRLRQRFGLTEATPVLVWVGRFVGQKRIENILHALALAKTQFPDLTLLLVGTTQFADHSVRLRLHQTANALQLGENVRFIKGTGDVRDYLHSGDVFVFPSEREGMPNAVLEAVACGLAVVASQIGGVTDILDEESAWLVPVGDVNALAQAISAAFNAPIERDKRAALAQEKVKKHFGLVQMVQKYENLLRKSVE